MRCLDMLFFSGGARTGLRKRKENDARQSEKLIKNRIRIVDILCFLKCTNIRPSLIWRYFKISPRKTEFYLSHCDFERERNEIYTWISWFGRQTQPKAAPKWEIKCKSFICCWTWYNSHYQPFYIFQLIYLRNLSFAF